MTTAADMKTKALAGWFGANRILAKTVGGQLTGCTWVGVPFCGGCSELPYIDCRGGVASDLHRHLINLARVVRDPALLPELMRRLDATLFHPDELAAAQARCQERELAVASPNAGFWQQATPAIFDPLEWAYDYFVCVWMARGGSAGTDGEFRGAIPTRWNANGGGSNVRYRSAVESLAAWHQVCRRWEFETLDCFDFLDRVKDGPGKGIYADAPWPDAGDGYRHKFTERMQRDLAKRLAAYRAARVVIRFGRHPLIEELYPRTQWTWVEQDSRNQANGECAEVLIINGPSLAGGAQ